MKKFFKFNILFLLMLVFLVSCNSSNETTTATETEIVSETEEVEEIEEEVDTSEKSEINLGIMTGPTGVGSVNLIENSKNEESNFIINETIVGSADVLVSSLANGDLDFAVVPANLASVLFHNTQGNIKVLATNNLGVVYIVDTSNEINSLEDLKKKTIIAAGKGTTPELVFKNIAIENGINPDEDLTLDFKTEATEVAQGLISGQAEIGLIPEPMVTNVLMQNENARVAIDLNEEWKNAYDSEQITSVLIGRNESIEEIDIEKFLEEFEESINQANESPENTANLSEKYNIVPREVVLNSIINMNLKYMDSNELRENLDSYLSILFETNPESIGGEMPSEDFYLEQ